MPPTESTPLITTVNITPPPRRRLYGHSLCRRFCTIALTSLLVYSALSLILGFMIDWPASHHHHRKPYEDGGLWNALRRSRSKVSHEDLLRVMMDTPEAERAEEWSRYYTAGPHLAGKNLSQAEWTRDKWEEWGVESGIVAYEVYLNYPEDHSLRMLRRKEKKKGVEGWKVEFEASLAEDVLEEDPTSGLEDRIMTFHGYSASGNVTAPFVYVNYGTYQDYEDLRRANVSLKGKIAIARYGHVFRGLKIKRAQELGMVGCLLYSDPGDDGEFTEENGHGAYPDGPARNPTSVQRGSANFLSIRPGDPSTPGYPSKPGVPRAPVDDATPSIPSIPISFADALPILTALNGYGPKAADMNKYWNRNLGLGYKGVGYNVGPTPDNIVLNLYNKQNYVTTPLWNVIGVVNGTIPNEVIVVGNHRDAWIAGGAVDPNSGSAVLNEVVRSVGKALEKGWKPLRTIVFASWDGEEYALIGSTEWVEEYLPWLDAASVAYLNVDVGVGGSNFDCSAAPLLHGVLKRAIFAVPSPNQTVEGQTVGDTWGGRIKTMGSGSDFTAFQDFAGIPSVDMGFKAGDNAAYHYHSNYDSFYWMSHFGDPGFLYHRAMARVLGRMLAEMSNTVLVPFSATTYADELGRYLDQVEERFENGPSRGGSGDHQEVDVLALRAARSADDADAEGSKGDAEAFSERLLFVRQAIKQVRTAAEKVDADAQWCREEIDKGIPWWRFWHWVKVGVLAGKTNYKYKTLERAFLYEEGLDGRSWFKHVVFAPGLWTGYAGAVYPGLMESIDVKDYVNAYKWAAIIHGCLDKARKALEA